MITRILTGLVLLAVAAWVTLFGGWWMLGWVMIVAVASTYEMFNMLKKNGVKPLEWIGYGLVIIMMLTTQNPFLHSLWVHPVMRWIVGAMVGFCLFEVLAKRVYFPTHPLAATARVVGFVCCTFTFIYLLREGQSGLINFLFCLLIIWTCDSFAYFGGRLLGKTPLSSISPKKTWEGSAFGFVGSLIVAWAVIQWCHLPMSYLFFAAFVSIISQVGDLHESLIKRHFKVKDSSQLLPGHGGVYDRADSTLFVSPLSFFFFNH